MMTWAFDHDGPDVSSLHPPVELTKRRLSVPRSTGLYVVTCGDCLAHVGTSSDLRARLGTLARLGTHRGSAEVLCASFCTGKPPLVWWEECADITAARIRERSFKAHYGEPPRPRPAYAECVNGSRLVRALVEAAGPDSWEAGHAEAVFAIGEKLHLLFSPRLHHLWKVVRVPPGPWTELLP